MTDWTARRSGWGKRSSDARSDGDIDYGRIVHSASFRRLQGKTQILNLGDSDFYRTRLTHSLEVAQIATGITRQLAKDNVGHPAVEHLPDLSMIQAIGSTHDLGHPPFGHGGEVALNYCMRDYGGFEGNGQTLRILTLLEKFSEKHGADLTRRTLLGTLKYPVSYSAVCSHEIKPNLAIGTTTVQLVDRKTSKPPKCYMDSEHEVVNWILAPLSESDRNFFTSSDTQVRKHSIARHKSLDCSIMDLADDVAFGVHDLEDSLALHLITRKDFEKYVPEASCAPYLELLKKRYPSESGNDVYDSFAKMLFGDSRVRKHAISRLVGYFIHACVIIEVDGLHEPLIRFRVGMQDEAMTFLKALKRLVYDVVIRSPSVQHLEFKGQQMVVAVFEVFCSEPESFLPPETLLAYKASGNSPRVICDHVAGMTDSFLLKTYERFFSPRMGSVFDRL